MALLDAELVKVISIVYRKLCHSKQQLFGMVPKFGGEGAITSTRRYERRGAVTWVLQPDSLGSLRRCCRTCPAEMFSNLGHSDAGAT